MTLGAEIRSRRESAGMSQADLKHALESASQQNRRDSRGIRIPSIHCCPLENVERWESGEVIPTPHTLQALAYVFEPNPAELIAHWERLRKEGYVKRGRKAPPEERATPEPSGTVDLCMTDGEESVKFEGVGVEEAVRRFRDFLTWQIAPNGGGVVFVSCATYPKGAETGKGESG